jgi:uncharacterized metal-binding protein
MKEPLLRDHLSYKTTFLHSIILRCSNNNDTYRCTIDLGIKVSKARESTLFCLVPVKKNTDCKIRTDHITITSLNIALWVNVYVILVIN